MKIYNWCFSLLFLLTLGLQAQNQPKSVLFTIENKPYYTDEFIRIYKKNIDLVKDESQKDLNKYLDLYVGYKLKLTKAYALGLDKTPKYEAELKSYRNQLAKNYLTDTNVTKELMEEAYERSKKEINASHILILCDEDAAPADTLKAYNQIATLRKRAVAGEDFSKLAQQNSQDPSAKENKGELGYFSVFRMLYPFETGAYKTPKGGISKIVRTRFGYHIIKVNDIRDNRGEVSVAHIMILNPQDSSQAGKAEATINDIYKKLQQGEDFAALAKQFSEDKTTSNKGGVVNRFGSGQLSSSKFEDVAFSLTKEKPLSAPFKSEFGWHIVKLVERFPVKSMDEIKSELESKIKKDDRSKLIAQSMNEKLRKKYPVKRNDKLYNAIAKTVNKEILAYNWKLPADTKPYDKTLLTIKDKKISGLAFMNYILEQQKTIKDDKASIKILVNKFYTQFENDQLNQYYNDNLEKEFPEFSFVMDEYRSGLLLFDLMEKEIWNKAKNDSIGIQNFYEAHKDNYRWKNRLDALLMSSTQESVAKNALKMLKKGKKADAIKQKLNTKDQVSIMDKAGVFEEGNTQLPNGIEWKTGVQGVLSKDKYFYAVKVNKVLPEGVKTLDECRGKVINDYQQFLEENWVNELKREFKVQINQDNFQKVKSDLKL